MKTEQITNPDDLQLKAERDAVEQLFATNTLNDSKIAKREMESRKLAASLFLTYCDIEERDEALFGPSRAVACLGVVEDYINKADKIYEVAGDYPTAQKIIRFLQVVDAKLAKDVVESL